MPIEPNEIKRIVLLVSTGRKQENSIPDYEGTVTFESLSHISKNIDELGDFGYWLICTEQSKDTAEYIDQYFANRFKSGIPQRIHTISGMHNAREIYDAILRIASETVNANRTVYCDCTGGTKTMSVAMALACNHFNLVSENQTRLELTFIPQDVPKNCFRFQRFDLSRFLAEEQNRYVQQQNRIGRMQILARFSAILAHEIKNPLNLINADLFLLNGTARDEYSRNLLREIEMSVNEITRTIDNVRQVVRGEEHPALVPEIGLREVVRRLALRTEARFPKLGFRVSGDVDGIRFMIAEEKLYTIFTNLIDNAAKATDEKGTVSFCFEKRKGRMIADVRDDGPGIPKELHPFLFRPGLKKETAGTGMGLHIVKVFVSEEGGSIAHDENFSGGTRFIIELPLEADGE